MDRPQDLSQLVFACLERVELEGPHVLDELCARHPEHAEELRQRVGVLLDAGFLQSSDPIDSGRVPKRLGDFEIGRRLGAGGMGVVYLARQISLDREVALKLMRPDQLYFGHALERFHREVATVAKMKHPGIVPVYAVGVEEGIPYFAMEYVDGTSVDGVVGGLASRDPARLTGEDLWRAAGGSGGEAPRGFDGTWTAAALFVVEQVAGALAHAHERGILHRDVKPSNVMLTRDGTARVVDFGLARTEGSDKMTGTGAVIGTMAYMAPEQLRGEEIDARADVYALGVTLYELLTLRRARTRTDETSPAPRAAEPLSRAREINPAVSWEAETICLVATDPDPGRRYPTAAAFAADLRRVAHGRPIAARRPDPWLRLRRWAQRHPVRAAMIAFGIVLVVGSIAFAVHQARAARETRAEFERAYTAVETMLARVGHDRLLGVPKMDAVRVQLVADALDMYREMLARHPGDRRLRRAVASTSSRLGEMRRQLGDQEAALEALRRAHDGFVALVEDTPGDESLWEEELAAARLLGQTVEGLGDPARAMEIYTSAIGRADLALDRFGDSAQIRLGRAVLVVHLAEGHRMAGRLDRARELYLEAEEAYSRLAADDADEKVLRLAALVGHGIGLVEYASGRLDEAARWLRRGVERHRVLVAATDEDPTGRLNLCMVMRKLAEVLDGQGEMDEAGSLRRSALDDLTRLVRDFPQTPRYAYALAQMRSGIGLQAMAAKRLEEAEAVFREALSSYAELSRRYPEDRRYSFSHARALVNLGDALSRGERLEEADEALEGATKRLETLAGQVAGRPDVIQLWIDALDKHAFVFRKMDDVADAVELREEAVARGRELVEANPGVAAYASMLGRCLHNLAVLRRNAGARDDAVVLLTEAVEHQSRAWQAARTSVRYWRFLDSHVTMLLQQLLPAEDYEEALDLADRYLEWAGRGRDCWQASVFFRATLAHIRRSRTLEEDERRELADHAASRAVEAIRRGWKQGYCTAEFLRKSSKALESIRGHPEWVLLQAEIGLP